MSTASQTVMSASVSIVESFRWWSHSDQDWQEFVEHMNKPQTPQMIAGQAFHKAIEFAGEGEFYSLAWDGHTFEFAPDFDGVLALGQCKEIHVSKQYGALRIRGRLDNASGLTVTDYKTTFSSFDAEKLMESCQWRFYLDMTGAYLFNYEVFELYETSLAQVYTVKKLHPLRLFRYPGLAHDCQRIARDFLKAAQLHPEIVKFRNLDDEL